MVVALLTQLFHCLCNKILDHRTRWEIAHLFQHNSFQDHILYKMLTMSDLHDHHKYLLDMVMENCFCKWDQ